MYLKKLSVVPCSLSLRLLTYGLFAVICQIFFLLMFMDHLNPDASATYLIYTYADHLEYPLASAALVVGGSWLIDKAILA